MAGLYYSDVSEAQTAFTGRVPALPLASIYDLIAGNSLNKVRFEDRIRNVFGLVDYRFNDAWSASAEARYGDEDKEIFRITNATGGAFTAGAAYQAQAYEPFTWRSLGELPPDARRADLPLGRQGREDRRLQRRALSRLPRPGRVRGRDEHHRTSSASRATG